MPAALQGGERAEPAVLLALDRRHQHVAAQCDATAPNRLHGDVGRQQAGLHVARTAAEEAAVSNLAAERRLDPRVGIAGRHHVDVTVEHQRRPIAGAGQPTHESPRLRPWHLHSRKVGVCRQRLEVELPMIDIQSAVGEQTRHVRLRLVLTVGAADARLLHDVGDRGDERILEFGDRLQHAGTSMRGSRHAAERTAAKFAAPAPAPRRPAP